MRDQSSHVTMTHEQAVQTLLEHCDFDQQTETIPLIEAYHRVLAEDIVAKQDKPNCLTCLMDSVAVHWDDFENGMPDTSGWERGKQWEFANTGIGMPEGFDSAIVVENVTFSDDDTHVSFAAAPSARFAGTKPAGSTFKEGELLIWSGTVITPGIAAVIAEAGYTQVSVIRKPRVAFIPTGNELVPPQGAPARAKVVDSNSIMLRGKVREWGGEPITYDIVPDDPELIEQALRRACEEADIVVINAGSSKGSADFNIEVLEKIGTVFYHETNHGPGHHSSGAVVDGTPVVGISGPPRGAGFTSDFYLKPLVNQFLGQQPDDVTVLAKLTEDFPTMWHHAKSDKPVGEKRPSVARGDEEFYSIRFVHLSQDAETGELLVTPVGSKAGEIELEGTDAYYPCPSFPGAEKPKKGDMIRVILRAPRL